MSRAILTRTSSISATSSIKKGIKHTPHDGIIGISLPHHKRPFQEASEIRKAIIGRRSSKGFLNVPIELVQLSQILLDAFPHIEDENSLSSANVKISVLAFSVDGLDKAAYSYNENQHELHQLTLLPPNLDIQYGCMGQSFTFNAAAIILFHAPLNHQIDQMDNETITESHFFAGQIAQSMYLNASRVGVGITAMGAFDDRYLAVQAQLPYDNEIVYIVALGVADDGAFKEDLLSVPYSHGVVDKVTTL